MRNNKLRKYALMMGIGLIMFGLGACNKASEDATTVTEIDSTIAVDTVHDGAVDANNIQAENEVVNIALSDEVINVDGVAVSSDISEGVYVANDIIYYETGKDFTYGEGTEADAHSPEEAANHTVVHITKPGTYRVGGKLSKGQIAIDLGEDAKDNPDAVVTLIMDGADITCDVAPAVIFYNVYECGNDDADSASKDVDTSSAGANVIIADDSVNIVNGSYVAKIYKPDSVVLSDDKTEVVDSSKLHKYDGAFYSKMSMNIAGGESGNGILNINAENEGLDSELHLTINGGIININSGNDGINTNEDGVSVTTINGGSVNILVNGGTGEGDGIDSNGWLVINGGNVCAQACSDSADAGIDSDMGIHINGGTVMATGHMLDRIEDGGQTYAVFNFNEKQTMEDAIYLKDETDTALMEVCPENSYYVMIYSSPELVSGTYTLWSGDTQLANQGGLMGGPGNHGMNQDGMTPPEGMEMPAGMEPPEGMEKPEGMEPPEGMEKPEGMEPPEGMEMPEGMEPPGGMEMPEGVEPPQDGERPDKPGDENGDFMNPNNQGNYTQEKTHEFQINEGANMFGGIS